jgi:glycosyltransferase involved in cell wall biosynthesis
MVTTTNILTVAAITGGRNVPSARFRVRQLIPALRKNGIHVHEFIPRISKYPPEVRWIRPLWGIAALTARIPAVLATHWYDVVFLQRELVSTFLTLELLTTRPRVLDVDDAVFLYRGGRFAERIAGQCDLVICGNDFLSNVFKQWNKNVRVIPTAIDTKRYVPNKSMDVEDSDIIGWIGTSSNFKYLYEIEPALAAVLKACPDVTLRIIADKTPHFPDIEEGRIDFIPWSHENEVKGIQGMSIGIMPLSDSLWARGKCSFKMLQYMACGVPVVASPVGMNAQVLSLGAVGLGASNTNEWVSALVGLLMDRKERATMGINGRNIAEEHFSVQVVAPYLGACLFDLVS